MVSSVYIIIAVIMVVVFTLYMALDAAFGRRQRLLNPDSRIETSDATYSTDSTSQEDLVSMEETPSDSANLLASLLSALGMNVEESVKAMRQEVNRAGFISINAPYYLLFMDRVGKWFFAAIGLLVFFSAMDSSDTTNMLLGFLIMLLGLFGPKLYLKNCIMKRERVLLRSFPDALDLLVVCVESGLALDAALARVCQELGKAHPEITKEFNRTRLELALLNDRSQALQNLAERTHLVPFRSLVAALIQTEKFGTSLADTLRVLSDDNRQARLAAAETKAGRLPALMAIPLVCLLLPALFLILLGPAYIRVAEQGGIFGNK